MNTNWSSPKRNIFAAMLDLRMALASGHKAKLIRMWNEECNFPIEKKSIYGDFRCYEFSYGTPSTVDKIKNDSSLSDFEKHLTLNYHTCYGTENAMNHYYNTGELSKDNFRGVGFSHLVKVADMVNFFEKDGDIERVRMFKEQYITGEIANNNHFWDFFRLKKGFSQWNVVKFKHKVWVVALLDDKEKQPRIPVFVHILNVLMYPTKFIPVRDVLRMTEYTDYTFRIGDITNGISVQFQIPKKFSF